MPAPNEGRGNKAPSSVGRERIVPLVGLTPRLLLLGILLLWITQSTLL